ncbi:hypothetical protein NLI96_g10672 [Meripilus lineatus]|uniref:DUF6533 domain-containing protein n=1 Tax=Meripilus lineatus TaxID=2056292 RepID=A0AAD5Y934_9APHY|nr:hypothetical protein NLI96_g10672 [Physisporinus lineatus]
MLILNRSDIIVPDADIPVLMESLIPLTYWIYPTVVLVIYSYLLTLHLEIVVIWARKPWDLVKAIFLLNRYLPLFWLILNLINIYHPPAMCVTQEEVVYVIGAVIITTASISQAIFAAVRIYAIYQKNIKFGMLVFVVYMVPVGLRIAADLLQKPYNIVFDGDILIDTDIIKPTMCARHVNSSVLLKV